MDRNYDAITIISKYPYFKKTWSSCFCLHYQNCNHIFIKTITKDSKKVRRIRNYVSKSNLYVYFFM